MSLFGNLFHRGEKIKRTDITKRFQLIGRVGQGSMSKVWKAHDHISSRLVALKVLDRQKTLQFESRFKGMNKPSEGEIALSLHHPHIVSTLEYGMTTQDEMFLVMEYIDGVSLSLLVDLQNERMRRYRLRYMIQIGESLDYFHRRNWIHRDICPRNLLVTDSDQVKLIDFGLTVPNTPDFRKPGNRTGTASYMAPELIKRHSTDQRIDVFSYAVTCYELYTKRHPWDAAMTIDAVLQHINKPPHHINDFVKGIDPQIADTIMKGLEGRPDDRWQTAGEMVSIFREAESRLVRQARAALAARKQKQTLSGKAPKKTAVDPGKAARKTSQKTASQKPAAKKSAATTAEKQAVTTDDGVKDTPAPDAAQSPAKKSAGEKKVPRKVIAGKADQSVSESKVPEKSQAGKGVSQKSIPKKSVAKETVGEQAAAPESTAKQTSPGPEVTEATAEKAETGDESTADS